MLDTRTLTYTRPLKSKLCTKCQAYSRRARRCLYGKANPRTKRGVREAASIMGISYICSYNKWKQDIIHEMQDEIFDKIVGEDT